jgi:flagellar protein FlgJ
MDLPPISARAMSLAPAKPAENDLRAAAQGFEEVFLAQLLKGGRASLPGSDLTTGQGVQMAQDMLDMHMARHSSGQARLGIAEAVIRQFSPKDNRP